MDSVLCISAFIFLAFVALLSYRHTLIFSYIISLPAILLLILHRTNGPGFHKYVIAFTSTSGHLGLSSAGFYLPFCYLGSYFGHHLPFFLIMSISLMLRLYAFKKLSISSYHYSLSLIMYFGSDFFIRDFGEIRNGLGASLFLFLLSLHLSPRMTRTKRPYALFLTPIAHVTYILPAIIMLTISRKDQHIGFNRLLLPSILLFALVSFAISLVQIRPVSPSDYVPYIGEILTSISNYIHSEYYNSRETSLPLYIPYTFFIVVVLFSKPNIVPPVYRPMLALPLTALLLYIVCSPFPVLSSRIPTLFTIANPLLFALILVKLFPLKNSNHCDNKPVNLLFSFSTACSISFFQIYKFSSLYS
jgi:hypothetical protein